MMCDHCGPSSDLHMGLVQLIYGQGLCRSIILEDCVKQAQSEADFRKHFDTKTQTSTLKSLCQVLQAQKLLSRDNVLLLGQYPEKLIWDQLFTGIRDANVRSSAF